MFEPMTCYCTSFEAGARGHRQCRNITFLYIHVNSVKPGLLLHGPSMFAVKAKIYGVIYKQSSSIAFDETSSYWSAPKNY